MQVMDSLSEMGGLMKQITLMKMVVWSIIVSIDMIFDNGKPMKRSSEEAKDVMGKSSKAINNSRKFAKKYYHKLQLL